MKSAIMKKLLGLISCTFLFSSFGAATNTNILIRLSAYSLNTTQFDVTKLPLTLTNSGIATLPGTNFDGGNLTNVGASNVNFIFTAPLFPTTNGNQVTVFISYTNGIRFSSNIYPITSWSILSNCGCITWMSNATLYLICTNSINGNATTNKLGGL